MAIQLKRSRFGKKGMASGASFADGVRCRCDGERNGWKQGIETVEGNAAIRCAADVRMGWKKECET